MATSAPEPADWIKAYAKVQKVADKQVLAALRASFRDINKMLKILEGASGIGAAVRREQLLLVRQTILARMAELYRQLGQIIIAQRLEAAAAAVNLMAQTDAVLFAAAGQSGLAEQLRIGVTRGLEGTVDVLVTRMTQSRFDLAERIYRSELWMQGQVERLVNSALARGLTAREFAKEARHLFDPSVPGGQKYAAMRLARTEINNAFHAISVNQMVGTPWVTGGKWHLSRSHPKSDDCDTLANEDRYGLGQGVFPSEEIPRKPHPQCFCFVTPVTLDEDEFLNSLVSGKYDSYIRKTTGLA